MQSKKTSTVSKFSAFLQVSRANLLLTSIGHATLGLFLGASSLIGLFRLEALLFIILHYVIALFGCNINSYSDYEVDRLYKKYMSDGVDTLGKRSLRSIIFLEAFVAMIFIIYFFLNGFFIVSILAFIGFIGALLYSVEPVRIKKHGLISPVPVLVLYSFPILGGWFVFQDNVTWVFLLFLFGYMFMNQGFTLVNTCEDYSEDKEENIKTWAHIFGLRKTLNLAFIFSLLGLLCILSLVITLINQPLDILFYVVLFSVFITFVFIIKASFEVHMVVKGTDLEKNAKEYGVRLQKWFMMTRYPLMITAILLLL